MLAIVVGLVFFAVGLWGMVAWWADLIGVVKGLLPIMLTCGGLLAIVAGLTSIRDMLEGKSAAHAKIEQEKNPE